MSIIENSTYKFEKKFSNKDAYHVKLTKELLEDLENYQNINEVLLNINEKIGTFTIQSKNNSAKVFNLNIEPILRGEKESVELNMFRSNKTIESIAPLNIRLNVQATSKVYDMTKKKMVENADETRKHYGKESMIPFFHNKNSLAYPVNQNKDNRKSETNHVPSRSQTTTISNNRKLVDPNKIPQFTIREKILHLLALKPSSKDALLMGLHRLGGASGDRKEVEKQLHQLATINKQNLYQLSNEFVVDIRDDWPHFNDENRRTISKLKSDVKLKLSGTINTENRKSYLSSPKSSRSDRHDTISPADSHSSSKTITSNDEGFVSGDKSSPQKSSDVLKNLHSNKRYSQHLSSAVDEPYSKKMRQTDKKQSFAHIDSSSSCDVTPKSDVSVHSNSYKSRDSCRDYSRINRPTVDSSVKANKTDIDEAQFRFNKAYEEYMKLCTKIKERENEINLLRTKSKTASSSEYAQMYKVAKSLLDQLETPEFLKITARVKHLETEMCGHLRVLKEKT